MGKIYGYDEELWVKLLIEHWESGERDVGRIARVLEEFKAPNILDLGCGIGRIAIRLASKGYRVTGIDISELCIEKARAIAREWGVSDRVEFIAGDYRKLDDLLGEKKFDAALCIHSRAWEDISDAASLFSKLRDHVREGGIFIIQDICGDLFFQAVLTAPTSLNWFKIVGELLLLSKWKIDFLTLKVSTFREIYRKEVDNELKLLSRISNEYKMFSLSDYAETLTTVGWKVIKVERVANIDFTNVEAYSSDPWSSYSFQMTALNSNTSR